MSSKKPQTKKAMRAASFLQKNRPSWLFYILFMSLPPGGIFFTKNLRLQPQLQFCDISGQVKKNKGFLQPGHPHGVPVLAFQLKQTAAQGQTAVSGPGIFP
jgi:hypothetical protein